MNNINQLYGSIALNILNPIEKKLNEIGWLLKKDYEILNFKYYYNVGTLAFNCQVWFEANIHYFTIDEDTLRNIPVEYLVIEIAKYVLTRPIAIDPEYQFENENEQAMLDAAMDYGFV